MTLSYHQMILREELEVLELQERMLLLLKTIKETTEEIDTTALKYLK